MPRRSGRGGVLADRVFGRVPGCPRKGRHDLPDSPRLTRKKRWKRSGTHHFPPQSAGERLAKLRPPTSSPYPLDDRRFRQVVESRSASTPPLPLPRDRSRASRKQIERAVYELTHTMGNAKSCASARMGCTPPRSVVTLVRWHRRSNRRAIIFAGIAKHSFAGNCVPKHSLGTREEHSLGTRDSGRGRLMRVPGRYPRVGEYRAIARRECLARTNRGLLSPAFPELRTAIRRALHPLHFSPYSILDSQEGPKAWFIKRGCRNAF